MKPTVHLDANRRTDEIAAIHAQFSPAGILQRQIRHRTNNTTWHIALILAGCGKRAVDIVISGALLVALSPFILTLVFVLRLDGHPVFTVEPRVGRWSVPFDLVEFNINRRWGSLLQRFRLQRLPSLINVLRGEMSLIGPRASRSQELNLRQRASRKRSSVRPGLLSLWWLRKKANIDFGSELEVDLEYVDGHSVASDCGIALRAIPSLLYGAASATAPDRIEVLGIPIDNFTMDDTLQYILDSARGDIPRQLCFVNTDCVNKAHVDPAYTQLLRKTDLVLADGIGIRIAGKIMRREIRQNVNGTDLFRLLCRRLQNSGLGLFLLGARPGVVEAVAEWVQKNYPGVVIRGHRNGYFEAAEEAAVLEQIRDSGAQILLVAFGSPRQDLWIAEHLPQSGAHVAMGVGGLFDFYSGRISRAPQWMRELSLEWIYRLYQEPQRMWRRYLLGNAIFLFRVVKARVFPRPDAESSTHE